MLIHLIIMLIIIGAALYIVSILPINGTIKTIIYVIGIVLVAIYVLQNLGGLGI